MEIRIDKKFEIDAEDLYNPVVLVGWPGIALVAKLAITSIKDSIKAEEFIDIVCYDFPPKSNVENGKLEIPSAKIYYKPKYEKTKNDFFILTANYQPQTSYGVFEFSQRICEEMDKITNGKIKMYLSTGAMVSDKVREIPTVYVCGTDSDIVDSFLEFDNTKLMETGVIAGANGILPAWAGHNNFAPGICVLAETLPLPMMTIDPRSSKALVTLLKDYFKIDMNFDELNKKIEEMEDVVDKYKKQADKFLRAVGDDKTADSYYR